MTEVSDDLVYLHTRIAMLEALANHLRHCGLCVASGLCHHGELLWKRSAIDVHHPSAIPSLTGEDWSDPVDTHGM